MKAALIFTPNQLHPNYRELAFRDDSIGSIPPLSLMYVAAIMEQEGVEVLILDMAAERLSYSEALARVELFSPDLLGFTITTMSFHPVLNWIKRFKKDTALPVLVGGDHLRLYPEESMTHEAIDYCILGEAEIPLPIFIKAFRNGDGFDGIEAIGYRFDGRVVINRTTRVVEDIDTVPLPAVHLIKNQLYENIIARHKNFTAMVSSRGCPFNCTFCNANQQKYRLRSPKSFVDEIERNLTQFNIRDFDIYDSTFTADHGRVLAICNEISQRGLDVTFSVRSRVDVVDSVMLDHLKMAGCHTIMYGIESSNAELLRQMNKSISPQQVSDIIEYTNRSGIRSLGFFMFGYPGESRESIEDTIRFALALPLDYAQFTILVPMPDTVIYAYYRERGLPDYWADYTRNESCDLPIELIDTRLTRNEVSACIADAYRRFYFRPRIIMNSLMGASSLREVIKLAGGAAGLLRTMGRRYES